MKKSKYYLVCESHKEKVPAFEYEKQTRTATDLEGSQQLQEFLCKHKVCARLIVVGSGYNSYKDFTSNVVSPTSINEKVLLKHKSVSSKKPIPVDNEERKSTVHRNLDSKRSKSRRKESSSVSSGEVVDSLQPSGTGAVQGQDTGRSTIQVRSPDIRRYGGVKRKRKLHNTVLQKDRFMIDGILHVVNG